MKTTNSTNNHYSAHVRIDLLLDGDILPISHLGPDFLILRVPIDHAPARAEIDMWIDDDHDRWPVHLVDGISAERVRTRIAGVAAEVPSERVA